MLQAIHPDEFINDLINFDRMKCLQALDNQINSLKNPPKSKEEVLNALVNCGLKKCIRNLK